MANESVRYITETIVLNKRTKQTSGARLDLLVQYVGAASCKQGFSAVCSRGVLANSLLVSSNRSYLGRGHFTEGNAG